MKLTHVKPLTKNHDLDCNVLKNYRPVPNLSFLSKIIQIAVVMRSSQRIKAATSLKQH